MITQLVYFIIYLIVIGLVVWLLLYLVDVIPIPEPFHKVARVVIIAVGVIALILMLLSLVGEPGRLRLG